MREIRCVIADKRLIEVLDALDGLTLEPPVVVRAAQLLERGEHTPIHKGGHNGASNHLDLFIANAKKAKATQINARQLTEHMKIGGFSAHAYSYRLHQLLEEKVLKRTKAQGIYEIVSNG